MKYFITALCGAAFLAVGVLSNATAGQLVAPGPGAGTTSGGSSFILNIGPRPQPYYPPPPPQYYVPPQTYYPPPPPPPPAYHPTPPAYHPTPAYQGAPNWCNVPACSSQYDSFRASDCTFQPWGNKPRRRCRL